jgi:hypothetical protein
MRQRAQESGWALSYRPSPAISPSSLSSQLPGTLRLSSGASSSKNILCHPG